MINLSNFPCLLFLTGEKTETHIGKPHVHGLRAGNVLSWVLVGQLWIQAQLKLYSTLSGSENLLLPDYIQCHWGVKK